MTAIACAMVLASIGSAQVALAAPSSTAASETKKIAQAKPAEEKKEAAKTEETPKVMVTVAEGDSLSIIAEKHNTTWVRLFNANESISHPDIINPGQELRVPAAEEQLAERALPQPVVAAPVASQATNYQASAQTYTRQTATTSYPVSANSAKAFIYNKESGNNPNATNPNGCYGIGQDCNGVLRAQCGADYACQDAYFDGYAQRRYGSWEAAYAFWQANGWW